MSDDSALTISGADNFPVPVEEITESEESTSFLGKYLSNDVLNYLAASINEANEADAQARVVALRAEMPEATREELINKLIYEKCKQTATTGAVTAGTALIPGIGPAFALTFGVAVDTGMTFKMQAELVLEIAAAYDRPLKDEEKQAILLGVTGVNMGSDFVARQIGKQIATEATKRLAGQTAVKAIPYLGVAASAGLNMVLTYLVGQRAIAYFGDEQTGLKTWEDTVRAFTGVDQALLVGWLTEATLQTYAWLYPEEEPQPTTAVEATSRALSHISATLSQWRQQAQTAWEARQTALETGEVAEGETAPASSWFNWEWETMPSRDWLPTQMKMLWQESATSTAETSPATDQPEGIHIIALLAPTSSDSDASEITQQLADAEKLLTDEAAWAEVWLYDAEAGEGDGKAENQ